MKFTPSLIIDAPSYQVDHFDGRYDTDKCVILRDLQLETDSESMPSSLKQLSPSTNVLDLTNNDLFNIPWNVKNFKWLHTLLLSRNRIINIDGSLLPCNLENLVLANNGISELQELDGLSKAPKSLKNLTLKGNPICHLNGYREYVLKLLPNLMTLDFTRVTPEERKEILKINKEAKKIGGDLATATTTKHKERLTNRISKNGRQNRDKSIEMMTLVVSKMTDEKKKELKKQLAEATSLDEIARLEKILSGGV
ncbi:U2 snRNP complex subunit LEA1 NDAI_0F01550 [Naumovozyma dairenensis CBS 421]|uniref:U2 small nuclear ribonucleoprotein A' n=1 Tax=Naumovozyma dairenensis (strain ATCC 10597 / BCRC 20456 / CBS 421 / NBRC 0211 / NRRL Y-12639) TaxID=1071378 RepID=G0WCG3_NAUDC|nr:hypothetical protein NDAI_0F01550 [Naumovozyma dairenensis CBS 421]CCD25474.1 hypothetical protein NDAI_0F01550 [Naumovozyma dairenensis CBS 421]